MGAPQLILNVIVATVSLIAIGVIGVFGFTLIEPFHAAFGEPPSSLGWGTPGSTTLMFASFGMVGMLLVLVVWFVASPIQNDRRQQYR